VTAIIDRLLRVWLEPLGDEAAAQAAFREVYADPVSVNGTARAVADLVGRARDLQAAFEGLQVEIIDRVEAPERIVIAFWMRGRHVGPLPTPIGVVASTGRVVEALTIDVLTVTDRLVTAIWVVADDLGLLRQLDGVTLTVSARGR